MCFICESNLVTRSILVSQDDAQSGLVWVCPSQTRGQTAFTTFPVTPISSSSGSLTFCIGALLLTALLRESVAARGHGGGVLNTGKEDRGFSSRV